MHAAFAGVSARASRGVDQPAQRIPQPQRQEGEEQREHDVLMFAELKWTVVEREVERPLGDECEQEQTPGVLWAAVRVGEPFRQKEAEQRERNTPHDAHDAVEVRPRQRRRGAYAHANVEVLAPHEDDGSVVHKHREDSHELDAEARQHLPGVHRAHLLRLRHILSRPLVRRI